MSLIDRFIDWWDQTSKGSMPEESENGKWLPKEGRYEKLAYGQWRPSTRVCLSEGHTRSQGTIPCPLYAQDSFKCERCGFETPNPKYVLKRAKKYWEEYSNKFHHEQTS